MLEGILGRGFASKCKSLIKQTTTRIDTIRRKRNATTKFLKEDIAYLLVNGLDLNAFGRAEGLLVEMRTSSCYDFVEQSCEFILKHLSAMQKQSECPEECRVAVSSLMFAAARFSDLPELRDLRHIFQEKYGNSLENVSNREFVENLASKPPTLENKVRLLHGIASEFLIKWDCKAFELRISKPPTSSSNQWKTHGSSHPGDKLKLPKDVHVQTIARDCNVSKRDEDPKYFGRHVSKHKSPNGKESTFLKKENCDVPFQGRRESSADEHELRNGKEEQTTAKTERQGSYSHGKSWEHICGDYKMHDGRENTVFKRDGPGTLSHGEPKLAPGMELPVKSDGTETAFLGSNHDDQQKDVNSRKVQERTRPSQNIAISPPYHKSRRTRVENAGIDWYGAPMVPLMHIGDDAGSGLEGTGEGTNHPGYDRQVVRPAKVNGHLEHHHEEDVTGNTMPKRRSSRRCPKIPTSHHDHGTTEDIGVEKRNSSSRRDKSRQGLHILLDDANEHHHRKDEEERLIDKLLFHYSHKPSSYDPEKMRHRLKAEDASRIQQKRSKDGPQASHEIFPHPARSASLPHEQTAPLEAPEVFTRTASLQPAGHVHPKLPDYDDLAARFAAMKGK